MPDAFVPLAIYLRTEPRDAPEPALEPEVALRAIESGSHELGDALRETRRFRAALADALEAAREDLLRDFAADVLARELILAPADVEGVARRALERIYEDERPLQLRAHPADAGQLHALEVPIVTDATLRRGDVVLELRQGSIDLSLGARLAAVLSASRSW